MRHRRERQLLARSGGWAEKLRDRPTLIFWGERDFAFRRADGRCLETLFPHNQTHLLPSAEHSTYEDAPDEIGDRCGDPQLARGWAMNLLLGDAS